MKLDVQFRTVVAVVSAQSSRRRRRRAQKSMFNTCDLIVSRCMYVSDALLSFSLLSQCSTVHHQGGKRDEERERGRGRKILSTISFLLPLLFVRSFSLLVLLFFCSVNNELLLRRCTFVDAFFFFFCSIYLTRRTDRQTDRESVAAS